jgi:hypothetical protein
MTTSLELGFAHFANRHSALSAGTVQHENSIPEPVAHVNKKREALTPQDSRGFFYSKMGVCQPPLNGRNSIIPLIGYYYYPAHFIRGRLDTCNTLFRPPPPY